ncbi:hypothetical protein F3087_22190 [Nocardia colli]|uniref:Uncharacterized protein n=1 Tax=Nocardia colli TaxID=2545717 RepID=A0A5N0EEF3_9NOCA|nr:hypothetical protein F3087_22190 [Nocardia colli]
METGSGDESVASVADAGVAEGTLSADVQAGESGSAADDVAEAKSSFDVVVEPSGSVTVVADGGDAEADARVSSDDERVVDGGADSSPQS